MDALLGLNRSIRNLTISDLNAFWNTLDLNAPVESRDRLLAFLPTLVAKYGDVAATVAADWYSNVRRAAGAPGLFTPSLATNTATAKIEGTTRRLASWLFTDTPDEMLTSLAGQMSKYVLQSGPNTIIKSAGRDPWKPRVARVPTGATTCGFCLMLASRGPVYASVASAGSLHKFHPHDDCQIVIVGRGDALPEGYEPAALYDQYQAMKAAGETGHNH